MIPKIIHYCWFGGAPLPPLAEKCIQSWKKYFPDYEIKEWNESNFNYKAIAYTREAYTLKKYAFVSDYARMWILYNYGGIYFDTDVEVIKPMDDIIQKGPFMGLEAGKNGATSYKVALGLGLGVPPGLGLLKKIIDWYSSHHYANWKGDYDGTIVRIVTDILQEEGMTKIGDMYKCGDITIYPPDYFCPKNYYTEELVLTDNTRTIHHYSALWKHHFSIFRKIKKRLTFIYVRLTESI